MTNRNLHLMLILLIVAVIVGSFVYLLNWLSANGGGPQTITNWLDLILATLIVAGSLWLLGPTMRDWLRNRIKRRGGDESTGSGTSGGSAGSATGSGTWASTSTTAPSWAAEVFGWAASDANALWGLMSAAGRAAAEGAYKIWSYGDNSTFWGTPLFPAFHNTETAASVWWNNLPAGDRQTIILAAVAAVIAVGAIFTAGLDIPAAATALGAEAEWASVAGGFVFVGGVSLNAVKLEGSTLANDIQDIVDQIASALSSGASSVTTQVQSAVNQLEKDIEGLFGAA